MATKTKPSDVTAGGGSSDETPSCLQRFSNTVTGGLEDGFARLGRTIGTYPLRFICGCIFVATLSALGLIAFREVTDSDKLWVPDGAQVISDKQWISDNYPSSTLREQMIGVGASDNVLTPTGLAALLDLYQSVAASTSGTITLTDVCIKAGSNCLVYSILELWSYDDTTIRALDQATIISDVNSITTSPMYNRAIDLSTLLGIRTLDGTGQTTAAQAALMTWFTEGNDTLLDTTESWETGFISIGNAGHSDLSAVYVFATRSFSDAGGDAISGDVTQLSIGYFIVIIFVVAVLGKFNAMEQRVWLAFGGFLCVGLSILVSIGLSSAFQQEYGPLQSILPFLLLGIGVDDMFVIMGAYTNLPDSEKSGDIPSTMSNVMRHAGVSITVTSLTDFVAFMIGATTIIPALRSFCIYAGIGIIALYLLQAMLFSAFLSLDLQRMRGGRNGCCCCIKHDMPYTSNACSQKQIIPAIFKKGLARVITHTAFKVFVLVVGFGLFAMNVYGFTQLEQYFNPNWFLPSDSYAFAFTEASDKYFPISGFTGYVYCSNINYYSHQTEFTALEATMSSSTWITNGTTDPWFSTLTDWLAVSSDAFVTSRVDAVTKYPTSEAFFIDLASQMTTETTTTRTANYLVFDTAVTDITASRFPFRHIDLGDAATEIEAMDATRASVAAAGFSGSECFAYARIYLQWETNKVIREELYRNLALALVCVFLVTLLLIANFWTSCMVFVGVLFTLVDVAGSMHFWGLTIDTVTSIILILSIGLAVDYCAHIGHFFMTIVGSRHERTKETVGEMGPPVFYGGFSTFLAFALLAASNSYVFKTFFKVNFLVVIYGLFHGLVFVPVLLSWLGPAPYPTASRMFGGESVGHAGGQGGEDNNGYTNGRGDVEANKSRTELPPLRSVPPPTGTHSSRQETDLSEQSSSDDTMSPPPSYTSKNSPPIARDSRPTPVHT